jgi:hypothetical protein
MCTPFQAFCTPRPSGSASLAAHAASVCGCVRERRGSERERGWKGGKESAHIPATGGVWQRFAAAGQELGATRERWGYSQGQGCVAGETDNPQGVVNTSDGRVVRAFHRFTLVDQTGQGRDLTKGRRRDQGAVKISCARQVRLGRN